MIPLTGSNTRTINSSVSEQFKNELWLQLDKANLFSESVILQMASDSDCIIRNSDKIILSKEMTLSHFLSFRPLIYFCVFGNDQQFEMLKLSLKSLDKCSEIICDILIITNVDGATRLRDIEDELSLSSFKIHIRIVNANSFIEFTAARYQVANFEDFADHGPVLYLDTDVLCDASILPMMKILRLSHGLAACTEGYILDERDFWGRTLFLNDKSINADEKPRGFSTGVLGASTISEIKLLFRDIYQSIDAWNLAGNPCFRTYDQPIANYVVLKSSLLDRNTLGGFVRIVGHTSEADPGLGTGIAHFAGGIGNNRPKIARMKVYYEKLEDRFKL